MRQKPLYCLENARNQQQLQQMIALEAADICIFCPEAYTHSEQPELLLDHEGGGSYKKQVLWEGGDWVLLKNEFPYPGTLQHLLLAPKSHATRFDQLSPRARAGFWEALDAVVSDFPHYDIGIRNGTMRETGATIAHLHLQVLVSDPNSQIPVVLYFSRRLDPPPSL